MKWQHTKRSEKDYNEAPLRVQKDFDKQAHFLAVDLRYPSLRAKKYNQTEDFWQARVNDDWRFYFKIIGDTYLITRIVPHPK
jgi:plasmid maintenance system killer protein